MVIFKITFVGMADIAQTELRVKIINTDINQAAIRHDRRDIDKAAAILDPQAGLEVLCDH